MRLITKTLGITMPWLLTSCGYLPTASQLDVASSTSFSAWCQSWQLESCEKVPSDKIPSKLWPSALEIADALVKSPSSINFERGSFESSSVQNLLMNTLGRDTIDHLNQIPWSSIYTDGTAFNIEQDEVSEVVTNGLRTEFAMSSRLVLSEPGTLAIDGITLNNSDRTKIFTIKTIDLSVSNRLTFENSDLVIEDIPLEFILPLPDQWPTIVPSELLSLTRDVLFDQDVSWRNAIDIQLNESNLETIHNAIVPILEPDAVTPGLSKILETAQSANFGGTQSQNEWGSLTLKNELSCEAKLRNIPVLGSATVRLDLDQRSSLSKLKETSNGFSFEISGIDSNFGKISRIEVDGSKIKAKIGWLTIPVDVDDAVSGENAIAIDSLTCS
ncbi:hypothetical protein [Pseudobacteriovorax antillogorgiicola]|uniref:Uncharacterized protein n=1 Tax=Pseudobacteriovorax antillogorgiicola TaxID=1513793 RepID=A0A1Y6CQB3_9BACT|nr:hypothetical protein [Pseudobacteriovorax antillogorgiicola]TCS47036.1 hypothetical protein EDD56_122131 [Pseudobacteriovorax antillogorgiicola]SMF65369.1 hypothetical protein SAMN06296036_122131 [Pseudobacteriovorax antillogorgiicola]